MGDLIIPPAVAVDYDEIAKRVWERLIPVTPVSGAFEEKFKQTVIPYELIEVPPTDVTVAAGSGASVFIQPPAGETWRITLGGYMAIDIANARTLIGFYDGIKGAPMIYPRRDGITGGPVRMFAPVQTRGVITNSLYFWVYGYNPDTVSRTFRYSYSGVKLKSSSIEIAKLSACMQTVKSNPHSIVLPDYLEPLKGYAFIDFEGDVAIYLEKDTPLRKDEVGNIIERLDISCKLRDFERLFAEEIADTTKRPLMTYIRDRSVAQNMGWEKYIDKWKAEGIEF